MAAPHAAGAAAMLLGGQPSGTAAQVKGLDHRDRHQGLEHRDEDRDPSAGAGQRARRPGRTRRPVRSCSVRSLPSFGTIPSGFDQTRTQQVTVTNLGGSQVSLDAAVVEAQGAVCPSASLLRRRPWPVRDHGPHGDGGCGAGGARRREAGLPRPDGRQRRSGRARGGVRARRLTFTALPAASAPGEGRSAPPNPPALPSKCACQQRLVGLLQIW